MADPAQPGNPKSFFVIGDKKEPNLSETPEYTANREIIIKGKSEGIKVSRQ